MFREDIDFSDYSASYYTPTQKIIYPAVFRYIQRHGMKKFNSLKNNIIRTTVFSATEYFLKRDWKKQYVPPDNFQSFIDEAQDFADWIDKQSFSLCFHAILAYRDNK